MKGLEGWGSHRSPRSIPPGPQGLPALGCGEDQPRALAKIVLGGRGWGLGHPESGLTPQLKEH